VGYTSYEVYEAHSVVLNINHFTLCSGIFRFLQAVTNSATLCILFSGDV